MPLQDENLAWIQEDLQWCKYAYNLVIEVASARARSQAMWSIFLPQLAAGLLTDNHETRALVMNMIKRVGTTVLNAPHSQRKILLPGGQAHNNQSQSLLKVFVLEKIPTHMPCVLILPT